MEELEELFRNGTFFTEVEPGTVVRLEGLGRVTLSAGFYESNHEEKYKELADLYRTLSGEANAKETCRRVYHEYLENPSEYGRKLLKEWYEKVPEHERMYLGSMDDKDSDYVRIIYYPEEKREV
ncbi:hypothetical protein D3C73_1345070 [compost metagenome]